MESARKQEQTGSMDVEKMAEMMNELYSTIRALEEKLEATGMENDLLQQRMAEVIDERTGSTPMKFAKPSSDPIATHGDKKNFAKIATSGDTGTSTSTVASCLATLATSTSLSTRMRARWPGETSIPLLPLRNL